MTVECQAHRICLNRLKHDLGIYYRPNWLFLIVKVLATRVKFLKPSNYCAFNFHTRNVFGCLLSSSNLKSLSSWIRLWRVHLCSFQIAYRVKQCTTCQSTNHHDTANHSEYLPLRLQLLWSCCKCTAKLHMLPK